MKLRRYAPHTFLFGIGVLEGYVVDLTKLPCDAAVVQQEAETPAATPIKLRIKMSAGKHKKTSGSAMPSTVSVLIAETWGTPKVQQSCMHQI